MSQHDLNIANGSGAAVRADLNLALAALGSTSKGPNAPSAPLAGMLWVEDDNPSSTTWTLKTYDGADWISVGTINTSTNTFAATGAAPVPTSVSGAGQIYQINTASGASVTLPAGGTWFYTIAGFNSSAGTIMGGSFHASALAAGGTTIAAASAGIFYIGFAWRIA